MPCTGCFRNSSRKLLKILVSVNSNSRFKSGGICFVDNQLYWAADANGLKPANELAAELSGHAQA